MAINEKVETQHMELIKKSAPNPSWLDKLFHLTERKTDVKTEILAGITTFVTMSYIIFVNPTILADAGIPKEAAIATTIFATVFATLLFALWANMPIAVAPGMGLNAFFTYTVVLGEGLTWQTGLGAVFISGVVFFILTITGLRKKIIEGIPAILKSAISVGIGLFIAFIGFKQAGIIVSNKENLVALGQLTKPGPFLALLGFIAVTVLTARKIKGAALISILLVSIAGMVLGIVEAPKSISSVVSFSMPSMSETFLQMDIKSALHYGLFSIIFSFTLVELFDNLGSMIGLSKKAGLMDEKGEIKGLDKALMADSLATVASAAMGSTAMNAYVENAAGIAEGGKTGLKALVVAILFLVSLLFTPLISIIPSFATAPILIMVGALMLTEIKNIPLDEITDAVPAFCTIILMPLTFSIGEGLALGFLSYTFVKLLADRAKEIHWIMYMISAAFIINFVWAA
ncbi:NCS2 family permease [Priestia megaterium]|uniref:Inorganic anion transporter, sulfate permease (SulP) family n=1 Tax=Priestia megaterium (strain DSM 319 / IMG 1521) TaxID=592022 RepID=D5DF50_PRIM3|nr:solute carrier family 23 protein [Priestia megaterium]ADF38723.1 inorganic anion transporter, sulfate permease (SulP) family [Priestia megaterium DSM 319]MED4216117.1 NCS2 family permease [Priestia megaterium]WEZ37910.1 NCS2 family permease [Priestia megaterium DSM 319]